MKISIETFIKLLTRVGLLSLAKTKNHKEKINKCFGTEKKKI